MFLQDIDEVLFRGRRFPEDKDRVGLSLKGGGTIMASRALLEDLLEQARQQEDVYWIEQLERALAFLS